MSSRTEQAIETGRVVVEALVKEPVKEAVREALAEDRGRDDGSADGGYRLLSPKVLLPLLGLLAVAAYARQRGENVMDLGKPEELVGQRDEAATGPVDADEATTAGSETATSYESGPEAGPDEAASEGAGGDADEETAARS